MAGAVEATAGRRKRPCPRMSVVASRPSSAPPPASLIGVLRPQLVTPGSSVSNPRPAPARSRLSASSVCMCVCVCVCRSMRRVARLPWCVARLFRAASRPAFRAPGFAAVCVSVRFAWTGDVNGRAGLLMSRCLRWI